MCVKLGTCLLTKKTMQNKCIVCYSRINVALLLGVSSDAKV